MYIGMVLAITFIQTIYCIYIHISLFLIKQFKKHNYVLIHSSIEHKVFVNKSSTHVSLWEQLAKCAANFYLFII